MWEAVKEAGYLATKLRLVVRERRRREAELAALFATAAHRQRRVATPPGV